MRTTPVYYQALAWGFAALALLGSAAGSALDLYKQFWFYDEALHLYAIFAYTLVLALYAYGAVLSGAEEHQLLLVLVIASIGISLGVVWEVAEWAYDEIVRPNAIRGKTDTIIDLILDTLGVLAAGFACLRILK